jgi:hypothetical protein
MGSSINHKTLLFESAVVISDAVFILFLVCGAEFHTERCEAKVEPVYWCLEATSVGLLTAAAKVSCNLARSLLAQWTQGSKFREKELK